MAIQMQVKPRHVDAARRPIVEIDERRDARADTLGCAIRAGDQHRHLDLVHADAIEPAAKTRPGLGRYVGQRAQRVFA